MIIFATVHIRSTDQDRESGIYKRKKKKMMIILHAVRTEKGHTEFQQPINSISGLSSCYESPQQTKNKGH